ncbi:probable E3 ubiquitin-protein ligase ari8 [Phtheirospermum japonicum]|uniref:RBR-type E3 ubiquitin transferase n=1 Tax=Phtheirospermum japonicum TaxID=374723 RepID=A0A830CVZ0_9LAMI|nr:probable E3 ubiquitin-protein ligase ari8 [Phtheirospermum japonicum]
MDFYYDSDDYDDDVEEEIFGYGSDEEEVADAREEELLDFVALLSPRHKPYKILKEEEIRQLQESDILDVSNVLSVSRNVACTLLCQNNWMPSTVYDKWFGEHIDNKQPVIESAKPPKKKKPPKKDKCKICYDNTRIRKIILRDNVSAACGHLFCVDCWRTYISTSIENGPGCLTLTCPEPRCESHPGPDMVDSIASPDDKDKYYRYLYRSYVESSPNRKWCPAPGCDFAIEFDWVEGESYDVACDCGHKMCWNCGEEGHSPSDCETVAKWAEKNNGSEADSATWVTAYTKPCPKCRRSIEKNQGCNHMTCGQPCGFNFCWTCLGGWKGHGFGQCNGYKEDKRSDSERDRENAREKMERYKHYYERWDSNDKSRKRALDDRNTKESSTKLMFVVEAWEQIVECRRVLKWSYVYGYYLSVSEFGKLRLFEHLQGEAEFALERLHHCAEKEMDKYLWADCCEDFKDFRKKLASLTSVTKNYFENLVRALENNLSEVQIADRKEPKKPWKI